MEELIQYTPIAIAGSMLTALTWIGKKLIEYMEKKDSESLQREINLNKVNSLMYESNTQLLKEKLASDAKVAEILSSVNQNIEKNTTVTENLATRIDTLTNAVSTVLSFKGGLK